MKIVSVHEDVIPISSSIRNAWIDFSAMDCSIVAVVSDVVRDGEPVVGYGFNSNGRYSAGEILRRRIVPRLLAADPEDLLDDDGGLDPTRAWDVVMTNEKPGGHGERSVAVGVMDMALFDLAAKLAGQPLYRWLSNRHGDGVPDDDVFVYAAGGYYAPGKTLGDLQDEMRRFPHGGHQFSLHIAAALKLGGNESYPGEFQPTGGFADDAVVRDGRVELTDIPGIGFEGKAAFYRELRMLHT